MSHLTCFTAGLYYWKSWGQVVCYGYKGSLDWQCLIWSNSRLLRLPKGPRKELSSRTSAFWLRRVPYIALSLNGCRQTQFRSQQDWERPVALHFSLCECEKSCRGMRSILPFKEFTFLGRALLALLLSPTLQLVWKIYARC